MTNRRIVALAATAVLAASACSSGGGPSGSPAPSLPTSVGEGEGALSVLAWPGYAEDGTTSPDYDWISSRPANRIFSGRTVNVPPEPTIVLAAAPTTRFEVPTKPATNCVAGFS